jgi:ribosome-associated protein YbcJ (S4-like RNA binding protein)
LIKLNGVGNNGSLKKLLVIIGLIHKGKKVKVFIIENQNGYIPGYLIFIIVENR